MAAGITPPRKICAGRERSMNSTGKCIVSTQPYTVPVDTQTVYRYTLPPQPAITSLMRMRLIALLVVALAATAVVAPVAAGSKVVKNVKIVDFAFKPSKLTIKKGTEVKWTWSTSNTQPHNVTLYQGPKGIVKRKWKSKTQVGGSPFQRTFSKTGTYKFECTVHPFMQLKIVVKR